MFEKEFINRIVLVTLRVRGLINEIEIPVSVKCHKDAAADEIKLLASTMLMTAIQQADFVIE